MIVLSVLLAASCDTPEADPFDRGNSPNGATSPSNEPKEHEVSPSADDTPELRTRFFQTPSHNIICATMEAGLRCDIRSGLEPEPDDECPLDWVGVVLDADGTAAPDCAGDAVPEEGVPVLGYGTSWRLMKITCASESTGLTCTNREGHGFELARAGWNTF
jgi:hypothetical protein